MYLASVQVICKVDYSKHQLIVIEVFVKSVTLYGYQWTETLFQLTLKNENVIGRSPYADSDTMALLRIEFIPF